MNARAVLREAADRGVSIRRNGEALRLRGPADALEELRSSVAAVKADLMAILGESDVEPGDYHAYVVNARIDMIGQNFGVCIACGVPWELHGQPPADEWQRVEHSPSVPLVRAYSVVAAAIADDIGKASVGGRVCARCRRCARVYANGVCTFCTDETA